MAGSWFVVVALYDMRQDVRLFLYEPEGKRDETKKRHKTP